jgi:ABC-type spermidine/putrescine transport system permease subunit I
MNEFQDWGLGGAASVILLIASLGVVLIYNRIMRSLRIGVVISEQLSA